MMSASLEAVIARAAKAGKPMHFLYEKPDAEPELRILIPDRDEPIRDGAEPGTKLVIGHDPLRDHARNFRLDRIKQATTEAA